MSAELAFADAPCKHCGLPASLVGIEDGDAFCCAGCRSVYALMSDPGTRPGASERAYAELDDPTFTRLYTKPLPGGLLSVQVYLEGVHCAACVWVVERLPSFVPGVAAARLDLARQVAVLTFDPATVPLSVAARALDGLGYRVRPLRGTSLRDLRQAEDRTMLLRIGVAGAVAGNVMVIAFALYSGLFADMSTEHLRFFRWASLLVTLPSVLYSGSVFFRGALAALRARALHMDLPIALGLVAGMAGGAVNTIRGQGEVYFDSVAILILLLLVGRRLQQRRQRAAADAAELLYSFAPAAAHLVEGDAQIRDVPVEALAAGAVVLVRPGEPVPVDGEVVLGDTEIDASLLTGESRPVRVSLGDHLFAGTVNRARPIRVRAELTGEETRVGKLLRDVDAAAQRRAPVVQLTDRLASRFVAAVLAMAVLILVLWWPIDPARALENVMALLVVTCPCALALATPLAVSAAIGRAARAGILIKGGDALEALTRGGRLILDKTGTLTEGRTALVAWEGDAEAKPLVRAAEADSQHPVARALCQALDDGAPLLHANVTHTLGGGVEGTVAGRRIAVGSPAFVAARTGEHADVSALTARALTPVVVAVAGRVVATCGFGDPLRDDAKDTLAALRRAGFDPSIASGDHPDVVAAVGRELGLPPEACLGGVSPEGKRALVEAARKDGPVVMIGDGVNDAAALTAATVGIAVHGGAEASLAAADVFVTRPGLAPIADLVDGAHRTVKVIRRNLAFSIAYNLVGAALAATGHLSPLVAAVMMPLSSITVITSSHSTRAFRRPTRWP